MTNDNLLLARNKISCETIEGFFNPLHRRWRGVSELYPFDHETSCALFDRSRDRVSFSCSWLVARHAPFSSTRPVSGSITSSVLDTSWVGADYVHPHLSRLSEIDFGLLFRSLSTSWPQNCGLKDFTEFVIQSCSMVAVKDSLKSIGKWRDWI